MKFQVLALALTLLLPQLSNAATVVNGNFENLVLGTGWNSLPLVDIQAIEPYRACCGTTTGIYPYGLNAAFFGADNRPGGILWQDVATNIGQTYTVDFSYGAISRNSLQTLTASALGGSTFANSLGSASVSATGTRNWAAMMSNYSFTFTADSALTRLQFVNTSVFTTSVDGVLDNVAITSAVPEPGAIALFLAGLSVLGLRRYALVK
jgi:PEP-CTERM motif